MKNEPAFPIIQLDDYEDLNLPSEVMQRGGGLSKLEYAAIEAMKGFIVAYPDASRNEISAMARDQALDVFNCLAELEKEHV